jgi:hypothetical protein
LGGASCSSSPVPRPEKVASDVGGKEASPETAAEARQVISNHFHGPIANLAIASSHVTQVVAPPSPGDQAALLRYLGAAGVPPRQLVALERALHEDRADGGGTHRPTAGARVKDWAAQAATDLGTNAVGGTIATAITSGLAAFFGS